MNTASTTTPTVSAPFAWHERLDVTLEFLKDPAFAIRFALDHVPDAGMMRDFMVDWQEDREAGEDARTLHWLEMLRECVTYGQEAAGQNR